MKINNKTNESTYDRNYNIGYPIGLALGTQIGQNDTIMRGNKFGVSNDLLSLLLDFPVKEIEKGLAQIS